MCRSDADTCVDDAEIQSWILMAVGIESQLNTHAPLPGKLDGIANQIDENLSQPNWIAFDELRDQRNAVHFQIKTFARRAVAHQ